MAKRTPDPGATPRRADTSSLDDLLAPTEDNEETSGTPARRAAGGGGHRRWPKIFLVAALAFVLVIAAVLGFYLKSLGDAVSRIDRDPALLPDASATPIAPGDPIDFVLMGSDSRGSDQGRSDSLMVAHLSGDREHLYLVTFLRDMWVTIPANKTVTHDSKAKINAAYSWGGPALTIKTLQNLTGVTMDHAVVIDFEGFIKLTDTLGGVTVDNPQASTNLGYTFKKGRITIKGKQALAYVRQRYNLENGDLDRAARQRSVVTAIIDKTLTAGVLANPKKFNEVLSTASDTMTVDSGLTNSSVRSIATSLKFRSGAGVVQVQAPISGFGKSADGQEYDVVDEAGMKELSAALKNDTMADYVANHPQ
ncbi:MAG: LCP family protein [Acidipropionibacterium acidipropionici]|jgi:LCP family protein required for cell wall assembly|nr:LCP family protein [Acidipropionibacterium acidipropionici]